MSADTEQSDVPEEYADVDPVLLPLFEIPGEWFQDVNEQYETAFGPFADIVGLSPEAAVFMFTGRIDQYDTDRLELQQQIDDHRETIYVANESAAESHSGPAAWFDFGYPVFNYYERVPFENRVTTSDELRDELSEIMDNEPEWESLFESTYSVATDELGFSVEVDRLTDSEFHAAYKVLEVGRDESDLLTEDQKAVLNEAHSIIQEIQSLTDN